MTKSRNNENLRLDDAARAAWLYYVAQNTQDEIAAKMSISRQAAQRLVSLATRKQLVKFRVDHPVAACMMLAEQLRSKYNLCMCELTFTDPTSDDPALGIAGVAAHEMEKYLAKEEPLVMALGTGREIRGAVEQMSTLHCPQHKIVSLVGNLAPDGSASFNDVIMRIADKTCAPHYPLAVPVVATSEEERNIICTQKPIQSNIQLAQNAHVAFVGVGELNDAPPMLTDGFINREQLKSLQAAGGIGEIVGWVFDEGGNLLQGLTNAQVASVPMTPSPLHPRIGVARGENKLQAIRAALEGKWLSGLITDELTAQQLLSKG